MKSIYKEIYDDEYCKRLEEWLDLIEVYKILSPDFKFKKEYRFYGYYDENLEYVDK